MFGMLASPRKLRELGVIGMNQRNFNYIARNNPRHLYPLVDDKLKTKLLCEEHNIAAPKLIGVCRVQRNTTELGGFLKGIKEFVIKPSKGSGGKGILVITGRDGEDFVKPSGAVLTLEEVKRHTSNTLSGLYSLGGKPDVALIEDLVHFTEDFEGFSYEGVPDIRVIVYHGYPVMAMTRLSTHASDGKANLHQGAVGVGIDLATGKAISAVQNARPITHHPDTGKALLELTVPHWQSLTTLASRSFEMTNMGYLGADIVLDQRRGPLLLELNARPGLAIQVANSQGLGPRLKKVEEQIRFGEKKSLNERVRFSVEVLSKL